MQVSFYLNKQKITKEGDHPVYMYITFEGKRIRKSVRGVHCKPKSWDGDKERMKRPPRTTPFDEISSFNNRLDFIENQVKLIRQQAFDNRVRLTEKYILERLEDEALIKGEQYDFFSIADQHIASLKPMKAARTITGKQTVFNFLKNLQEDTGFELAFHRMNMEFFEALRKYAFQDRVVKDKNGNLKPGTIEDNYFVKIVTALKSFLNWAFDHDYIKDLTYKKFRAKERETEIICLTPEEFSRLADFKFESKKLDQVRDFFIFGCSTGLRFSDLVTLKQSNIQGEFIVKNIQKTRENSTIPLNRYSISILQKYKNSVHEVLPKISPQKFNKYLKECCEAAFIDTPTTITRFAGGARRELTLPKYKLITSHAARKTFATISLLMGAPERVVKNITGHKKESSFKRYVNFSKEFEKEQMEKVWDKI